MSRSGPRLGGTKQQRPLIPAVVRRISTSDVLKSCSQALSQPGPHLNSFMLWMGGSFQSLRPVVFGHGFDRTAGLQTTSCASSASKQEMPCGPDTKPAKALLTRLNNVLYKLGIRLTVQLFYPARNLRGAADAGAPAVRFPCSQCIPWLTCCARLPKGRAHLGF